MSVNPNGSGAMLKTGINVQITPSISGGTVAANEKTILVNPQSLYHIYSNPTV
jgi:hypothetical protein